MMNCVLIVTNFNAGRKKAVKYKKKVINFVLKYTKSFKFVDIDELKIIDVRPFDTILAMGGDGTVNKVLPYIINTDKILGIIPCGTANLLAAKLGLSSNINTNLKIIARNNLQSVDLMEVNDSLSALRCGFGYDSDIICKTPQSLKNKFGYFAYFISGILFALRLKKKNYKLNIGGIVHEVNASCLIFANASNMYKDMFSLSNDSKLDDALVDIFILKTANPILFFIVLMCISLKLYQNNKLVEFLQAQNVKIQNNRMICHIDGEKKILNGEISLKMLPASIKVFAK